MVECWSQRSRWPVATVFSFSDHDTSEGVGRDAVFSNWLTVEFDHQPLTFRPVEFFLNLEALSYRLRFSLCLVYAVCVANSLNFE